MKKTRESRNENYFTRESLNENTRESLNEKYKRLNEKYKGA